MLIYLTSKPSYSFSNLFRFFWDILYKEMKLFRLLADNWINVSEFKLSANNPTFQRSYEEEVSEAGRIFQKFFLLRIAKILKASNRRFFMIFNSQGTPEN